MRTIGDFNFAINFEPTSQKILDSRLKVSTKNDLITAYPNNNYYPKMVVTVEDENALYMLIGDDPANIDNWKKLVSGNDTQISIENTLSSSSTTDALSAAMGKKLNDEKVAKITTVNGKSLNSDITISSDDIINTNDPTNKQTVTASLKSLSDEFDNYIPIYNIGQANGVAKLDESGKVPES